MNKGFIDIALAVACFFLIGEAYSYWWGTGAAVVFMVYVLWTYERGYRDGNRAAWDHNEHFLG